MQFIQNECQLGNYLSINSMDRRIHGESSSTEMAVVGKSSRSMAEEAASKSHSEAERRRRKRINGHLATLRSLLPNTIKTDKASLLAEVVRQVRELKKQAAELAASPTIDNDDILIPTETDETNLSYCSSPGDQPETNIVKASVSCEDRPELVMELKRAVSSAKGEVVRAEMATVGGRTKNVLWVKVTGGEEGVAVLRRALKVVIDRGGMLSRSAHGSLGKKRPHFSHY
ncbi:hypothetical protein LguiB_032762 [Lonicera macranthoides]